MISSVAVPKDASIFSKNWSTFMTMEVLFWLENNVGPRAHILSDLNEDSGRNWYLSTVTAADHRFVMFRDPVKAILFKMTWC